MGIVVGAVVLGVAWNGAAYLEPRVLMHLLLGVGCVLALGLPADHLSRSGTALRLALPAAAVVLAGALGLIPLPATVLAWVAPGTAAAFPDRLHSAAIEPIEVLTGLGVAVLASGVVALIALGLRTGRRRGPPVYQVAAVALLVLSAVALIQHTVGGEYLYGVWPVQSGVGARWAPLINGNFNAFVAAGLMPIVVAGVAQRPDIEHPWTWVGGIALLAGLTLLGMVGALGAVVGIAAAAFVALIRWFTPDKRWPAVVATTAVLGLGVGLGTTLPRWAPAWVDDSLTLRLEQWAATTDLVADHAVLGVGPAGYSAAFPPYQPPFRFVSFDHVHSDPLEALAEIGVVGIALVVIALILVPRPRVRPLSHRATWLELALVAWLVHACVDFPLHLPGLLVLVVGVAAVRAATWSRPRKARLPIARGGLALLAGAQFLAALWTGHAAVVQSLTRQLRIESDDRQTAGWLAAIAPWRVEPLLVEARVAARADERDRAIELAQRAADRAPHDADLLHQAGSVLTHVRALDQAATVLDRAITRHAASHRSRALASRVAQARGDHDRAVSLWSDALQRWPYDLTVKDRPFKRALDLQPEGLWWVDELDDGAPGYLLVGLGAHLVRNGDPAGALVAFERAASVKPALGTHPLRGLAMIELGLLDRGLDHLANADDFDDNGWARQLRAQALLDAGRADEARDDARRALSEDPTNPQSQILRIRAEAAVDGVSAALDTADVIFPSTRDADPNVALVIAELAQRADMRTECARWLEPHASAKPGRLTRLLDECRKISGDP